MAGAPDIPYRSETYHCQKMQLQNNKTATFQLNIAIQLNTEQQGKAMQVPYKPNMLIK
jgi:hypothetical protein